MNQSVEMSFSLMSTFTSMLVLSFIVSKRLKLCQVLLCPMKVMVMVLFHDDNMIGETDRRSNFSSPHEERNENWVYDRGKQFF